MSSVLGKPLPTDYAGKKKLLSDAGIVLWDVYRSAEREGSMDSDIKAPEFNDSILYKAQEISQNIIVYGMPSTSPANASWTLRRLVNQWKQILTEP